MDFIRLVLEVAASKRWEVHHMDVKSSWGAHWGSFLSLQTKEINPWTQTIPKVTVFKNGFLPHVTEIWKTQIRLQCLHAKERGILAIDCDVCGWLDHYWQLCYWIEKHQVSSEQSIHYNWSKTINIVHWSRSKSKSFGIHDLTVHIHIRHSQNIPHGILQGSPLSFPIWHQVRARWLYTFGRQHSL